MDKNYSIYAIRCIANGKLYIGRTLNLEERVKNHFSNLKTGKHASKLMVDDFKKYGRDQFEVYLLEENVGYNDRVKEYQYMRKYNSSDEKYGYNHGDKKTAQKKNIEIIKALPPNLFEQNEKMCEQSKREKK